MSREFPELQRSDLESIGEPYRFNVSLRPARCYVTSFGVLIRGCFLWFPPQAIKLRYSAANRRKQVFQTFAHIVPNRSHVSHQTTL
jgi:hypothetical protein